MYQHLKNSPVWLHVFILFGFFAALGAVPPVLAEDRALIVGVGKYANSRYDLPGIDLDVDMMRGVVTNLGFKNSQVKVLMDSDATLQNVTNTIRTWLTEGTSAGDRALFYFSGHGTRIPDENGDEKQDLADEVLVMHDVKPAKRNGKSTLDNVLVDDHFNKLIKVMPSKDILIIVDSCHSGTITKSIKLSPRGLGESRAISKFLIYEGMPKASKDSFDPEEEDGDEKSSASEHYVSLSAAQDDEQSLATRSGSVFTLGVRAVVRKAAQSGNALSVNTLLKRVDAYVASKTSGKSRFHPQINGSTTLAQRPLRIRLMTGGSGVMWAKLEKIVKVATERLGVTVNRSTFGVGDRLVLKIDVQKSGYLNVVSVGPNDEAVVLYPNKYNRDNRVSPGKLEIPTAQMSFDLTAQAPTGPNLIVAMLTNKPVNLYNSSFGARNAKGDLLDVFGQLSPKGVRAFAVQARVNSQGKSLAAGRVETRVCKARSTCN